MNDQWKETNKLTRNEVPIVINKSTFSRSSNNPLSNSSDNISPKKTISGLTIGLSFQMEGASSSGSPSLAFSFHLAGLVFGGTIITGAEASAAKQSGQRGTR